MVKTLINETILPNTYYYLFAQIGVEVQPPEGFLMEKEGT